MVSNWLGHQRLRKCLILIAACAGLSAINASAQQMLFPVGATPYDKQMDRVRPHLATFGYYSTEEIPIEVINEWIIELRSKPYRFSRQWKTPMEVKKAKAADCKGKAVALYDLMQMNGATNVRLIIGKHVAGDNNSHVWLEWATYDGTYVLDPTFNWLAVRAETFRSKEYVPHYAFAGEFKYRAVKLMLVGQN